LTSLCGWWFGTFGLFFPALGRIIPTDEVIFFRGIETTNQIMLLVALFTVATESSGRISKIGIDGP